MSIRLHPWMYLFICSTPTQWNYPLLTSINSVAAAILSGCSVLIKHSDRTPLCAEHFQNIFQKINAPKNLVQSLHINHSQIHDIINYKQIIQFVQMTGSVAGGRSVYQQVGQSRFIDVGLELGGKDGKCERKKQSIRACSA
jgi:acyl-CoA reductase-like NAD-dependent aldehyde dehydrogenase